MSLQNNIVIQSETFKRLIKYAIGLFFKRRDFEGKLVRRLLLRRFRPCAACARVRGNQMRSSGSFMSWWQIFCTGSQSVRQSAGQLLKCLWATDLGQDDSQNLPFGPFQSARSGLELGQDAKHARHIPSGISRTRVVAPWSANIAKNTWHAVVDY